MTENICKPYVHTKLERRPEVGDTVGGWTLMRHVQVGCHYSFLCRCLCGKEHVVRRLRLMAGSSMRCRSCAHKLKATRHGCSNPGGRPTKLYRTWSGIKSRCYDQNNPKYYLYGGRGVTLAEEWHVFEAFAAAVGEPPYPKMSLDRKDGTKGYEPGNVRWADHITQNNNKSDNVILTHPVTGETKTQTAWSRVYGMGRTAFTNFYRTRRHLGGAALLEYEKLHRRVDENMRS